MYCITVPNIPSLEEMSQIQGPTMASLIDKNLTSMPHSPLHPRRGR
jgi:hypothetical protein